MEFKKGDIVFHKNLRMVGTFVGYAWESKEEADVDFEIEDGYTEQRHVSVKQLEKNPDDEEIAVFVKSITQRNNDSKRK